MEELGTEAVAEHRGAPRSVAGAPVCWRRLPQLDERSAAHLDVGVGGVRLPCRAEQWLDLRGLRHHLQGKRLIWLPPPALYILAYAALHAPLSTFQF